VYARKNDPIDFADKILELLADEPRRRRMGELGRARVVDHLAWPHEAPKLLRAYQRVFAPEAARAPRKSLGLMRRLLAPLAGKD
jgi:glycosyltransferase involved in cell wall biosynthesis